MSREIKYRIWSKEYNEYLSGEGYDGYHLALRPDGKLYDADCGIEYAGTLSEAPTLKWRDESDGNDVEQYTGLTDKNGKEIYEGDIIDYNSDGQAIGYVKYNAPHYELIDKEGYIMFLKGAPHQTIIGNIHENPELLEEK